MLIVLFTFFISKTPHKIFIISPAFDAPKVFKNLTRKEKYCNFVTIT